MHRWISGLFGVVAAMIASAVLSPAGSSASTYDVHECWNGIGAPDAVQEGPSTGPRMDNFCSGSSFLQAGSSGSVAPKQYRQWMFTAPNGTQISQATGNYSLFASNNPNGQKAYVSASAPGNPGDEWIANTNAAGAGFNSNFDLAGSGNAPVDRLGIGVACTRDASQGNCEASLGTYAKLGQITFTMKDTVAPASPTIAGPAFDGWIGGTTMAVYGVSDVGSGVNVGGTTVNGTGVDIDGYCPNTAGQVFDNTGTATRMAPCPAATFGSSSLDVTQAPFVQGENTIQHCVNEYGTNPAQTCASKTMKVDTIEPGSVKDPVVAGGQDWHRDNDFDISWDNWPQGPNESPIVAAELRIVGDNYDNTSLYAGQDIDHIDDVEVPEKGAYTAQIYLVDAAGNKTGLIPAISHSVSLKFDNTIPDPQAPVKANGWISRGDLAGGYPQRWENVPDQLVPPSGIEGYRVTVNTSSDSDPCTGAADPRACGGELTEVGRETRERTLHTGDLEEGANYVHVVPVSGSGMRATEVKHTPLKADFTDPVTQVQGDGNGEWINHPVEVTAIAHDALSGMTDTDEFPDDDPPATFVQVDEGPAASSTGSTTSAPVAAEGVHQVKFWARDLAGNTQTTPNTATVRVDETDPRAAFTNGQDPDDPDKLVAPVSDALSGVVGGTISYRQAGGSSWKELETALVGDQLVARVDSGDMRPGVTYQFRAQATDRAGNTVTSNRKQNGELMKVVGPFRALTEVVDLRVNGKAKTRVKYGKGAKVTGAVVRQSGGSVAGAKVVVTETYAEGSKTKTRSTEVATNGDGRFSVVVPKGPSRTISARYAGDRRYLGSSSAAAKLAVKGKVQLKVPKRVSSRKGITFKGKIGTKGAKLTKRGKRLEVQVHVGKKWKAVGKSIRTNKKGKFKLAYKFTADYPHAVTYEFRAKVLPERGFPYLPAKSKVRKVTVTP
jgi:hypothetical protein